MEKGKLRNRRIPTIILALLHRYGLWIAVLVALFITKNIKYTLGIGPIVFAVWTFLGYTFKWDHIFCSFQDAYRKRMTPNSVRWRTLKKSEVYAICILFLILGIVILIVF